nr:Gag-Pol polyprotein [Tanacetum cinerariifolium]
LGNGFTPHWIGDNIPNNQNGWIEEDTEEEEEDSDEDPKEDPKEEPEDDDDDTEMYDEAKVFNPYMDDGSNNPPPPNSEDEETPPTSPIIPDADGQHIPPIASFGQNFYFGESSSTANLLTGNTKIVPTGPMCPNLGMTWKYLGKMKKLMSERIETEGRVKKKFKEQDHYFVGLGCDNIKMDRTVRNVMSDLSELKKDGENLDKMKEKGDECIFVGYSNQSKAYRVFNKRTRVIMESIHVNFDELPQMASDQNSSDPAPEYWTVTTLNELDLLFSPMFDELLNRYSKVVSKSSAVSAADAPNQCQRLTTPLTNHTTPAPICQIPTLAPTVILSENINQAETYAENDQVTDDEFINIFSTLVQDQGETSSRHVDSSNMHTFYQRFSSEHRWTKDHPLEQVIGNPSQRIRTRRQLESDAEMYMLALTVSRTEPKNIKEAMADSTWIESMQEELHQFDRLDVWELVNKPLCTNVINLKWL